MDTFNTFRSSLWAKWDFTNVDKTRAYVRHSRLSALETQLIGDQDTDDAFFLAILFSRSCIPTYLAAPPQSSIAPSLAHGGPTSLHGLSRLGTSALTPENLANLRVFSFGVRSIVHPHESPPQSYRGTVASGTQLRWQGITLLDYPVHITTVNLLFH